MAANMLSELASSACQNLYPPTARGGPSPFLIWSQVKSLGCFSEAQGVFDPKRPGTRAMELIRFYLMGHSKLEVVALLGLKKPWILQSDKQQAG